LVKFFLDKNLFVALVSLIACVPLSNVLQICCHQLQILSRLLNRKITCFPQQEYGFMTALATHWHNLPEGNAEHACLAAYQHSLAPVLSCSLIDLLQLQERIFVSQTITRKQLTKCLEFPNAICCNSTGGWCCASDTARTLTAVRDCFHAESSLFEETRFFHPVRPELV